MTLSALCLRSYFVNDELQFVRSSQLWEVSLARGPMVMDNQPQRSLEHRTNLELRREMAIMMNHIPVNGTVPGWAAIKYEQQQAAAGPALVKYLGLMNAYQKPRTTQASCEVVIVLPIAVMDASWMAAFFWFHWLRWSRARPGLCRHCGTLIQTTAETVA